jgi:hypothetical protein
MAQRATIELRSVELNDYTDSHTLKTRGYGFTAQIANNDWQYYHEVSLVYQKRTPHGAVAQPNRYTQSIIIEPGRIGSVSVGLVDYTGERGWRIIGINIDKHYHPIAETELKPSWCFVATAVYGNPDHPQVEVFRRFRDELLARTERGQKFIGWYYRNGPKLASVVERIPALRLAAKAILTPAAHGLKILHKHGPSSSPRSIAPEK